MATKQTDDLDPRFDPAYQRGGASSSGAAPAPRDAPLAAPVLDDGATVNGAPAVRDRMPAARRTTPALDARAEKHFEIVVAGNPWLRALWAVGGLATLLGFVLTFYAEFAFSVPPASGIYDPSVYIVPRLAEALALPLVIAGVISLAAATTLRIVAWRPSGAREIVGH